MKEIKDFIIERGTDNLDYNKINEIGKKIDPLLIELFTEYYNGNKKEAEKTAKFFWAWCETIEICECSSLSDLIINLKLLPDLKKYFK